MSEKSKQSVTNELSKDNLKVKRRYPRRVFKAPVGVLVEGKYFMFSALELGEKGLMFQTDLAMKKGDNLVLSFAIHKNFIVITRSEVRYFYGKEGQSKVGVEFVSISFEDRRKIREFISLMTEDRAIKEGVLEGSEKQ